MSVVYAKIVLLAMLMLFLGSIPRVLAIENAFCVGTGYSNLDEKGFGLISMGASSIYNHPVSTIWGANIMAKPIMSRSDRPSVRIHGVSETFPDGTKKQLRGWLYLEIEKPDNQYFNALAVWASLGDDQRTSGEFVYLPNNSCGLWPDLNNYVPCSAVAVELPITSNMFIYTDDGSRKQRVFKLLWRLSTSYCNKPAQLFFFFAFNSQKWNDGVTPFHIKNGKRDTNGNLTDLGAALVYTHLLYVKFFGTSAPIYDPSSLSCTSANSEIQQTLPSWASEFNIPNTHNPADWGPIFDVVDRWTRERWDYRTGVENQANTIWGSTCKAQSSGLNVFGGRCVATSSTNTYIYARDDKSPECLMIPGHFSPSELSLLDQNGHFRLKLEERKGIVITGCDPDCKNSQVPTKMEVINVPSISILSRETLGESILGVKPNRYVATSYNCADRHNSTDRDLFGLCSLSEAGHSVYGVRQWHGLAMLFCSMIVVPIECFIARYLKGAIPVVPSTNVPHIPLRPWYLTHILLSIPLVCLFSSAMAAVERQALALGRSKTLFAKAHSFFGYVYFAFFVFQVGSGFLRPLNIRYRKMTIFTHWLMGTIMNYGGVMLCMLTYGIPSSPTTQVSHLKQEEFYKIYNHAVPMILIVWFVLEGLYHTSMIMYAFRFDRKHNIQRTHFPIFYPPMVNNRSLIFEGDFRMKGETLKRALFGYVTFCIVIYISSCIAIYIADDDSGFGLGPMSCTHDEFNKYITPAEPNTTRAFELRQFYIDNDCRHFLKT